MKIFVLGNLDLKGDDIVMRLLPKLKKQFPKIKFKHIDPLEGFGENLICSISDDRRIYDKKESGGNEQIIIIDAIKGISKVKRFDDLAQFVSAHKRLTMHDFDLYDELILLQKLKKLPKIAIIGLPWGVSEKDIWNDLTIFIQAISL